MKKERRQMSQKKHNVSIEKKLGLLEKQCRKHGLKVTPQRKSVYKALLGMNSHPTSDEVYRKVRDEMNNISLDTVNRTLHTLSAIGVAFVVEGTGQPRRFDAGMDDHQHFLCVKCGKVIDFHHEPFDNIDIPEELKGKFKILRKTVYFEGLCNTCIHEENHAQ
jgi:Fur family peroxide stress response transcriptional regulator